MIAGLEALQDLLLGVGPVAVKNESIQQYTVGALLKLMQHKVRGVGPASELFPVFHGVHPYECFGAHVSSLSRVVSERGPLISSSFPVPRIPGLVPD